MLLALERTTDPAHPVLTTQEQLIRICQIPVAEYLEDGRERTERSERLRIGQYSVSVSSGAVPCVPGTVPTFP